MSWLVSYVQMAFEIYNWLIIIRVFLSWLPHDSSAIVFRFIYEVTEPVLSVFRKLIGTRMAIDFSPVLAILVLQLAQTLIVELLKSI